MPAKKGGGERACVAAVRGADDVFVSGEFLLSESGVTYAYDAGNRSARGAPPVRGIWHRTLEKDRHGALRLVETLSEPAFFLAARHADARKKTIAVCVWHSKRAVVYIVDSQQPTSAAKRIIMEAGPGAGPPGIPSSGSRQLWSDGNDAMAIWSCSGGSIRVVRAAIGPVVLAGICGAIDRGGGVSAILNLPTDEYEVYDMCRDARNRVFFLVHSKFGGVVHIMDSSGRVVADSVADAPCTLATFCAMPDAGTFMIAATYPSGTHVLRYGKDSSDLYTFTTKNETPKVPSTGCVRFVSVTWGNIPRLFIAKQMTLTLYTLAPAMSLVQWRRPGLPRKEGSTVIDGIAASPMLLPLQKCARMLGLGFNDAMRSAVAPHSLVVAPRTEAERKMLVFRALYMNAWMNLVIASPAKNSLAAVGYVITCGPAFLTGLLEPGSEAHRAVLDACAQNGRDLRAQCFEAMAGAADNVRVLADSIVTEEDCRASSIVARVDGRGDVQDVEDALDGIGSSTPMFEQMARVYAAGTAASGKPPPDRAGGGIADHTASPPGGLGRNALAPLSNDVRCVAGSTQKPFVFSCNYNNTGISAINSAKTEQGRRTRRLSVKGMMATEKFDGVRALWDPVRGCFVVGKKQAGPGTLMRPPRQWERYFNREKMNIFLDGELWAGRGEFYTTMGILRTTLDWKGVMYVVFDSNDAALSSYGYSRRIDVARGFVSAVPGGICRVVSAREINSKDDAVAMLRQVTLINGEGIVMRTPSSGYADSPLYKLKVQHEMDVTTVGSVKEFREGTHTCTAQNSQHSGVVVMGVPDAYKQGAKITIAYNGFGARGGVLHARFERPAREA